MLESIIVKCAFIFDFSCMWSIFKSFEYLMFCTKNIYTNYISKNLNKIFLLMSYKLLEGWLIRNFELPLNNESQLKIILLDCLKSWVQRFTPISKSLLCIRQPLAVWAIFNFYFSLITFSKSGGATYLLDCAWLCAWLMASFLRKRLLD